MPNISGYKDLGGGLATLVFDDGQESQPVVLDDKLKSEVTMVASLVNPQQGNLGAAGANLATGGNAPTDAVMPAPAQAPAPSAPAPAPAAVDTVPPSISDQQASNWQQSQASPAPPTSAVPALSTPALPAPASPGSNGLPNAGRVTGSNYGADSGAVRDLLGEANQAEQQAGEAGALAKANAAETRGKLVGDRLAQMQIEDDARAVQLKQNQDAQAEAQKKYAAVSQSQPDPVQAFAGEPTWYKILTLIGLGAGAAAKGAAIYNNQDPSKVGNATSNEVDKTIQQSIDSQKAVRSSELTRLTGILGNEQAAESALKAQMQKSVENRLTLGIMQADNQGEADYYRATLGTIRAARLRSDAAAVGQTATSVKDSYEVPKPGKGGPGGPINPETATENAILADENVTPAVFREYGKEREKSGVDSTLSAVSQAKNVVQKLSNGQDVPGLGPWDSFATKFLNDPEGAAVKQALGITLAQFKKEISGAAVTDNEAKELMGVIEGPGWRPTKDTLLRGLAIIERNATSKKAVLDTTFLGASRAYDRIQADRGHRAARAALANQPPATPTPPAPPEPEKPLHVKQQEAADAQAAVRKKDREALQSQQAAEKGPVVPTPPPSAFPY